MRPPERAATLIEALEYHVERQPSRLCVLLYEGETQAPITYRDLWQGALGYASGLAAAGLMPGQTVAIMPPTSKEYLFTFYGTLLAGGVPVPLYPPARLTTIEDHLTRHVGILKSCGASLMVTIPEAKPIAWLLRAQVESLRGDGARGLLRGSVLHPGEVVRRADRLPAVHLGQHRAAERRCSRTPISSPTCARWARRRARPRPTCS